MFSLDQFAAAPPFSVLASVFLVIGLDYIGLKFLKLFGFIDSNHLNCNDWLRWQSPIIGSVLMAVVLYPLALLGLSHFVFMKALAMRSGSMTIYANCWTSIGVLSKVPMMLLWPPWSARLRSPSRRTNISGHTAVRKMTVKVKIGISNVT